MSLIRLRVSGCVVTMLLCWSQLAWAQSPFTTYVQVKQTLTDGDADTAFWTTATVPAMYQNWDGSSFTITTRMTVPTAAQLAGDGSSNFRAAGIFLQDTTAEGGLHRYIIGLTPSHFGRTNHTGKGLLRWENGGGLTNASTVNINAVPTGYFDVRVAFDSTTKVLDVDYRNEGEANYSDLVTHVAPAGFAPDDVGLAIYSWKLNAGPWAPDAGQQLQFDNFTITGGTGTAVSDTFDSAAFTAATWQYYAGDGSGAGFKLENSTTFTQLVPEPASAASMMFAAVICLARRKRRDRVSG
jgi:hypothetical protein